MANYALKWANGSNGDYPSFGDDCTNFVSQALYAGNWPLVFAWLWQRPDDSKWYFWPPTVGGLGVATYSWAGSSNLEDFTRISNRVDDLNDVWNATIGDLLFVDWDPNNKPDGRIDHVMIVTGVDAAANMPFISQHTPSRKNIPLAEQIDNAQKEGKNDVVWYGRVT